MPIFLQYVIQKANQGHLKNMMKLFVLRFQIKEDFLMPECSSTMKFQSTTFGANNVSGL